jgi:cation diffusion facilitator family transporter
MNRREESKVQNRSNAQAASLSVAFNVVSTLLKIAGAVLTRSVSLTSEAIHSAADVAASLIALFSVRAASAPPDDEHPYGHGKIESLAGFAESIFLLLTMAFIINEAVLRLLRGGEMRQIEVGVWIMAASAIASLATGLYVSRIGKSSRSLALQSNGQHLLVDSITSAGVLVALVIAKITGWQQADSIVAIILAVWIGVNAVRLSLKAYQQLIDRALPDDEIAVARTLLEQHKEILSFHRLRTRLSGAVRHIDVHIVIPQDWTVFEGHRVADSVEQEIKRALNPAEVVVHVDPFDDEAIDRRP